MKLPYDNTCDLIYGASGASPGAVYATGPCRLVYDPFFDPLLAPLDGRVAYATLEFAVPNEGKVTTAGQVYTTDYSFADVVAIPSGRPANFQVLFVEIVTPFASQSYYRVHLGAL